MQPLIMAAALVLITMGCVSTQQVASCSLSDEKLLRRRRIQGLRASILAQLGLKEPPVINASALTPPQELQETFGVLAAATGSLSRERSRVCESQEIYAQPISAFVGTIEGGVSNLPSKRSLGGDSDRRPTNLLAEYTISFEFNLSEDLKDFTKADLLLYQIPISGTDNSHPQQHVEITAVYESLGLSDVVSAQRVNAFEEGFQSFDVASAVSIWLAQGTQGNVTLVVSVKCFTSVTCGQQKDGRQPEAVSYKDFDSGMHSPRLIITSRNSLEQSNRNKRQASQSAGLQECVANQTTCCLKPLTISFADDLGMNFIVNPPSFEANYCEGFCPIYPSGNIVSPQLYQFLSRLQGSPASSIQPCCAGNTFENLPIVVAKTDGTFSIDELSQVKVTSCRCA